MKDYKKVFTMPEDDILHDIEEILSEDSPIAAPLSRKLTLAAILHVSRRVRAIEQQVGNINVTLNGNGHPEKGLVSRMLRVESYHSVVNRIVWLVIGALVAGGVALLYQSLTATGV